MPRAVVLLALLVQPVPGTQSLPGELLGSTSVVGALATNDALQAVAPGGPAPSVNSSELTVATGHDAGTADRIVLLPLPAGPQPPEGDCGTIGIRAAREEACSATDASRVETSYTCLDNVTDAESSDADQQLLLVDYPAPESLKQIYGTLNRAMLKMHPPLAAYLDETVRTLHYACSAGAIRNRPVVKRDPQEQLICFGIMFCGAMLFAQVRAALSRFAIRGSRNE